MRRASLATLAALLAWAPPAPAASAAFLDPLDAPARPSALAARGPLHAIAAAGERLVAVGERGHVLLSDDGGASWSQAPLPVSADLTAVRFVSALRGWAVGHGAILATADGGGSWVKQLDGRAPGLPSHGSLLDVWFADERAGLAVGAFGLLLRTDDGGASWRPWPGGAENPRELHLHAVARAAGDLWIVGEQGLVLRLDPASGRFRAVPVPYPGSFFGVIGAGGSVIVYGLRGHALRSRDRGASWQRIDTGVESALVASALLPDGRLVLVAQAGELLVSEDEGSSFRRARGGAAGPASGAAPGRGGSLVVVGAAGARVERPR